MSPPSFATAGRTRVSISSLMVATVSASPASKNSPASLASPLSPSATTGAPDMKCSMMTPRIAGLRCRHSPSAFVTVMKSEPRNTPLTFATSNRRSASGDFTASALSRISSVPVASTVRRGRNLRVAGLGVVSVWMNIWALRGALGCPTNHNNRWSFAPRTSMRRPLRQRVEILVTQMPRHDRHGNRIGADRLPEARDQRPRPLLAGPSGEHQDRDVLILVDQLEDLLGGIAVADHAVRRDAGNAVGAAGEGVGLLVGSLMRCGFHDFGAA